MVGQGNTGYNKLSARLTAKNNSAFTILLTNILDINGTPVDLTDSIVVMAMQSAEPLPNATATDIPDFEWSSEEDPLIIQVDAIEQTILITVPAAQTTLFVQDIYFYDIFITLADGEPTAIVSGQILVQGSTIRPIVP